VIDTKTTNSVTSTMPRLEDTGNTDFVRYLGSPSLEPKMDKSQGDSKVRTPMGKKIISQRGRLINRELGNRLDPPEESSVEPPASYQKSLNDKGLHRPPQRQTSMWA